METQCSKRDLIASALLGFYVIVNNLVRLHEYQYHHELLGPFLDGCKIGFLPLYYERSQILILKIESTNEL